MGSRKLNAALKKAIEMNLDYQRAFTKRDNTEKINFLYATRLPVDSIIEMFGDTDDWDLPLSYENAEFWHQHEEMIIAAAKDLGLHVFYNKYPVAADGSKLPPHERGWAILNIDPKFKRAKHPRDPYPISKQLRADIAKLPAHPALDMIAETVAEYEHGSAEVSDVAGVTLKQYAAVALDLALVISSQS